MVEANLVALNEGGSKELADKVTANFEAAGGDVKAQ